MIGINVEHIIVGANLSYQTYTEPIIKLALH